jgi:uncharacterized protein
MDFAGAKEYIIERLSKELVPELYYHSLEHTLDVERAANRLIVSENVNPTTAVLIQTAAVFHDAGMTLSYENHEENSCIIAKQILPGFGYTAEEIRQVCRLIIVTKLPQKADSLAEEIICDADLDPLGRDDFFINSFKLRLEWDVNGIRNFSLKDWIHIQIDFLENHKYFTRSQILLRQEQKMKNISDLKSLFI